MGIQYKYPIVQIVAQGKNIIKVVAAGHQVWPASSATSAQPSNSSPQWNDDQTWGDDQPWGD